MKMSNYLIELGEALCRHMPNKDLNYWMELIVNGDDHIKVIAEKFREEDRRRARVN